MKSLHLCTTDTKGGACRAAYRLHDGLRRTGHHSMMLVRNRFSSDLGVREIKPLSGPWHRIAARWNKWSIKQDFRRYRTTRPEGLEPFTDSRTHLTFNTQELIAHHDVVHLHWFRKFLDIDRLFHTATKPIVWTLHDMNAFTGGCHYNVDCSNFTRSCGACPQLGSDRATDLSNAVWRRKIQAYRRITPNRCHFVAPSRWMANEARRSSLLEDHPISVIPYGLDTEVFSPRDKHSARIELNLPLTSPVVLFVADSLTNRRKGLSLLIDAIHRLPGAKRPLLVSVGADKVDLPLDWQYRHFGFIQDDKVLAALYSAADIYVVPSLQDNLPNTVLESLACGTPVVGFAAGGIPEMVRSGETGWLATPGNTEELSQILNEAIAQNEMRRKMSLVCREVALREYDLATQARRYLELYQSLLCENTATMQTGRRNLRP